MTSGGSKNMDRAFDILLIGGASGVGKCHISYQLSKIYGMNVVQVDDFQCIVEHFTKEEDYPIFHYWNNHLEEARKQPMEKKLEIMISYANELSGVLELVIKNHLEEDRPMILEGDFISPLLFKKLLQDSEINTRIKCLYIIEDDKEQIIQNYLTREGSIQADRSELSLRYNNWIKDQIEGTEIVAVESTPWESTIDRICDLIKKE
jgi:2-phosphoglycerate kinase